VGKNTANGAKLSVGGWAGKRDTRYHSSTRSFHHHKRQDRRSNMNTRTLPQTDQRVAAVFPQQLKQILICAPYAHRHTKEENWPSVGIACWFYGFWRSARFGLR